MAKYSESIIQKKLAQLSAPCPLLQDKQQENEKELASVAGSD
jgi:hypothetical protein